MKEASKDKKFLARTIGCSEDFAYVDSENLSEIREKLLEAQMQIASGVPLFDFEEVMQEVEAVAKGQI